MCTDRIGKLLNSNRVDDLSLPSYFQKLLGEQVILIRSDELRYISDDFEDVEHSLFNGLSG